MSELARTSDPQPTPNLIFLVGVRAVRTSEPDVAVQWQEDLIKQLTDSEPMEMRQLSGDWLEIELDFSSRDRNAKDAGPKDPSQ